MEIKRNRNHRTAMTASGHTYGTPEGTFPFRYLSEYGTPEGTFPFRYLSKKEIRTEIKTKNMSFNRLIISFKRYNKSLKRYKIEWKVKQEKQNGN